MKIMDYIKQRLRQHKLHFSLIDPDPKKAGLSDIRDMAEKLHSYRTDAVMIGGSTNIRKGFLDKCVKAIKAEGHKTILFPGDVSGISRHADAIFFMSMLNSRDPYWISGAQYMAARRIKKMGIEALPMAYLIIEPGMRAGEVGKADAIKRGEKEKAAGYAMAAEFMGMKLVYLEAGSGAPEHASPGMIKAVKKTISLPLIVGGGIRSATAARSVARAGADIVITRNWLKKKI